MAGGQERLPFTVPPVVFSALKVFLLILIWGVIFLAYMYFFFIVDFLYASLTVDGKFIYFIFYHQLIRRIQGQDGEADGEEAPATPKKIFRLINQVFLLANDI